MLVVFSVFIYERGVSMGTEEETDTLYRNTIKYLHDVSEKVPPTLNVLKSFYASKFRISQLQTKINFNEDKNKRNARCPQCCLKLSETNPTYVLRPEPHKSKFLRKLLKRGGNKTLTRFQAKYLKKNKLRQGNQLVITCKFCKKEAVYNLRKPIKLRSDMNSNNPVVNKSKKKSKRDKFCGLQKKAVIQVQSQVERVHHKTANNVFNKESVKKNQKKHIDKLNKLLQDKMVSKNKSKGSLKQFLQFLDK